MFPAARTHARTRQLLNGRARGKDDGGEGKGTTRARASFRCAPAIFYCFIPLLLTGHSQTNALLVYMEQSPLRVAPTPHTTLSQSVHAPARVGLLSFR